MKKMKMGAVKPDNSVPAREGQYDSFSQFACGIPNLLSAVTTLKENGRPNAWMAFHSIWTNGVIPGITK